MRKKIAGIAVMLVVTMTIILNVHNNKNKAEISNLALENVEALASGEIIVGRLCMWQPYAWCFWMYPDELLEAEGVFI